MERNHKFLVVALTAGAIACCTFGGAVGIYNESLRWFGIAIMGALTFLLVIVGTVFMIGATGDG